MATYLNTPENKQKIAAELHFSNILNMIMKLWFRPSHFLQDFSYFSIMTFVDVFIDIQFCWHVIWSRLSKRERCSSPKIPLAWFSNWISLGEILTCCKTRSVSSNLSFPMTSRSCEWIAVGFNTVYVLHKFLFNVRFDTFSRTHVLVSTG